MGADRPKQFLLLQGVPLLVRTCRQFLPLQAIQYLMIVVHPDHEQETRSLLKQWLPRHQHHRLLFTVGGERRQDSVLAGLNTLPPDVELVLVHDGARPFIDEATILRTMDGALAHGAAIAAIPVKDTLKRIAAAAISATVDRSGLWQAQTPQTVRRSLLAEAFAHADRTGFQGTDEASLLEHHGTTVAVVDGSEQNMKVTRPDDLILAEQLLQRKNTMKIGHGYDAHRLVSHRQLILGGVEIDYHLGLEGHSDADVVSHALTDALLGAMGAGDIGQHFPDNDNRYKDISSLLLLEQVAALANRQGLYLGNADVTIICQRPRLAAHLTAMRENLARSCSCPKEAVNIKATTTENMGFTGRGEGIAAHAVVLLEAKENGN